MASFHATLEETLHADVLIHVVDASNPDAAGQIEAGVSSGLNYFQRMRFIILPQAVGVTVPPLLGQAIVLVKDTALLSLISVMELTRCGQVLTSERFMPTEAFFTVAFFYLCLYFCLKTLADWSQKKLIFREVY